MTRFKKGGGVALNSKKAIKDNTFSSNPYVRTLKLKCRKAKKAYEDNIADWEQKLPTKAAILASRYLEPGYGLNSQIGGCLAFVGRLDLAQAQPTCEHKHRAASNHQVTNSRVTGTGSEGNTEVKRTDTPEASAAIYEEMMRAINIKSGTSVTRLKDTVPDT
ncbi:hypothetical protein O1611_g7405 [Lasiodiplodia mahajangana]|uniref:Uncharacterized protein n=1 Tax=Lasiodiplodia mahajangana TaxID=1108764 RepID=A0ACC2JFE1_9PEZI|nr:hypothetical protein O1611_g7405 [Lasiodiplodia mahajangana]